MRYSLRTLVVVMLVGGPLLALAWVGPAAFFGVMATALIYGGLWYCSKAPPRAGG